MIDWYQPLEREMTRDRQRLRAWTWIDKHHIDGDNAEYMVDHFVRRDADASGSSIYEILYECDYAVVIY